jgi:serine/threonine protein kinase/tetratricopeptide (TPR) repeat protein
MECSAERDQRLMQLVSAALQKPAGQRESYLRLACPNDPELLQEASDVIKGEEKMGSFLLHPAIAFKDALPAFQTGELIAERFEIVREIGEGGMGVVYEAFDRKLNRRIAIKSAKPGFQPRLSPEIKGALAVSHLNICRVNEIHTTHTAHGDVDFLTMELLEGETLSAYLRTRSRLAEPEAFEIAQQICDGLGEAHRRGIIHRDLKSGNVILCRGENNQLRVVITDFGLAGEGTQSGDLGGTPRYIAPELWKGEKASKASDIYALGVILYDMVAGQSSQDGVSTLSHSDTNVTTATHSDRLVANTRATFRGLSHRWARTIARCLSASPEDRPESAAEVLAGLKKPSALKLSLLAVPLLLFSSLLFPGVRAWWYEQFFISPSVRLVVLPAATSEATAVVSGGALQDASDRISHLKSGQRTVAVIPPTKAQELRVRTPQQAQQVFHATHALQTSVRRDGQDLIVEGSVIDLETQAQLRAFSSHYSLETAGALAGALAGEVSSALNLRGIPSEKISASATAAYDRGLYYLKLDVQNLDEAIRAFEEAAQLDPASALPLAGIVEAEIGNFDETREPRHLTQAERYLQMAESLDPDSVRVHLAAGMLSEATGLYDQALGEYLRVANLEPRNVYAFIRIAHVYDLQNMPEKAIETYRHATELDPTFYDPHQYFGVFYFHRGRYSEAADEFQRVIELAPGMYNAYTNLGSSLAKLGRLADAEKALRSALGLRETPRTLNNMGDLLLSERHFSEALVYLQKAAALTPNDYVVLLNVSDAHRNLGHIKESKAECSRAMNLALSELSQMPRDGYARSLVGYCAARLGDRRRAADETRQALHLEPGNNSMIRRAVLTYEMINLRAEALAALTDATPDLLKNLEEDPDLADFCRDPRFKELVGKKSQEIKK